MDYVFFVYGRNINVGTTLLELNMRRRRKSLGGKRMNRVSSNLFKRGFRKVDLLHLKDNQLLD